ncbi:MAG TPA: hypothetical protein VGV37_20120 [Aliidongia sp.]|uniref:Imm52 family immunity protein n=1 Tax=Aliidongia sp. TaxID=1914230 RepID=UPI002DDD9A43|nr:hypothetical protein [Aliidongia sp.]HEV2676844.1 hypothetical protein [Aliidongia sp.]
MTLASSPGSDRIVVAWPGRSEDAATSAARMVRAIGNFGRCDPRLDRWREIGFTQREASVPFSTLPPQLGPMVRRFEAARCRDAKGHPLSAPVFQVNARNTAFGSPLELSASVGNPGDPRAALPNRLDLLVPRSTQGDSDATSLLKPTLLALIDAWAPVVGRIDPPGLAGLRTGRDRPRVEVGWITYLASPLARLIAPPAGATVEPVTGGGVLLSLGEHPFDMEDEAALALWRSVQDSLAVLEATTWPPEDDAATSNRETDR